MSKSRIGKKHTQETKNKLSISNKNRIVSEETKSKNRGLNNYQFKGYYKTPHGKFETLKDASNDILLISSIRRWCKNPNKIISLLTFKCSKYLQSLNESPIGKTFKEIGFDFQSI